MTLLVAGRSRFATLFLVASALVACAPPGDDAGGYADPEAAEGWEGVDFDEENPNAELEDNKADAPEYEIPTDLPELVAPEIVVSLDGLTVHLFDRATGFSEVYPAGVGVLNAAGRSITPVGSFKTGSDPDDRWWYINRRWSPDYFAGLPFLRLTAKNSRGQNTYGIHGPITEELIRDYVSHGCIRMARADIIRLYWLVRDHARTPVTIQTEVEIDANGQVVDVGMIPAL